MCAIPRELRAAVYGVVPQLSAADDVPAEEIRVCAEEAVGHHLVHE